MKGQREGRCDMHAPLPGVIRHLRPHLDQTTDQPLHRAPDLLADKVKLPDQVKKVVGQDPLAQEYYYEKLIQDDTVTIDDWNDAMGQFCPSVQPLFHRNLQLINPALDFIRGSGLAIVTVEIFCKIKMEDKKKPYFIEIPHPVIISSEGQTIECSVTALAKHGWTARTIPQQALQRWHPEDVSKFILVVLGVPNEVLGVLFLLSG